MLQLSAGQSAAAVPAAEAEAELESLRQLRPSVEAAAAGKESAETELRKYAAQAERALGRVAALEQAYRSLREQHREQKVALGTAENEILRLKEAMAAGREKAMETKVQLEQTAVVAKQELEENQQTLKIVEVKAAQQAKVS
eukprot:SAG31_NODE_5591_length_2437_cov_1.515398_3_plen_142_part_00